MSMVRYHDLIPPEYHSEKFGAETQSHCQFHTPASPAAGDIAGDADGDTGVAAVFEGAAELVPADGVVDPAVTEGATPPAATATFAWVTLPLSPGLAMRMLTLTFVGATCVAAGVGVGELAAGGEDGVARRHATGYRPWYQQDRRQYQQL